MSKRKLILASSSPARRQLLDRLRTEYTAISPDINEKPLPFEDVQDMVFRLAVEKAKKVAATNPDAVVIGADQVGMFNNTMLCKPLTEDKAREHLQQVSGKQVRFYTAMCVMDAESGALQGCVETYDVYFRELTNHQIDGYIQKEQPLNCAGSFRVEGLGMALIRKLEGADYTALIGLPLIKLIDMLEKVEIDVLA